MLVFPCLHCKQPLSVPETVAGKKVRCPRCQGIAEAPASPPLPLPQTSEVPPVTTSAVAPPRDPSSVEAWRRELQVPQVSLITPQDGSGTTSRTGSLTPAQDGAFDVRALLSPAQAPDELGRLGTYRVLQVLGLGGMGVVFHAEDSRLNRPVALKVMLPALASSADSRMRFLREARAAAAVQHDHIITIYQVDEDRGVPFLAMALLQGETLEDRLEREPRLSVGSAVRIGREIAEGLAAAHARQLIHRDIKPSNIWLEGDRDRVKILDFGLARAVGEDARVTQTGAVVGTPAYMAPEQARGLPVSPVTDLFSLGCVLYRLCTGELPFRGKDTLATLTALALDDPPPIRERNPAIPAALSDLVRQLMAKDPAQRPSSARVVVDRLALIESNLTGSRLQPVSTGLRRSNPPSAPATGTTDVLQVMPVAEAPAETLPRWVLALMADGIVVVLFLSGLYFLVRTLIG